MSWGREWANQLCFSSLCLLLSRSLSVSSAINSEVIPSNGPVFVLSAMMSPAANQHVAPLEVVCVRMCVRVRARVCEGGAGSPLGKAHLLNYYLVLPANMRAHMHIKSQIHRLLVTHTASRWCNILYLLHAVGVLYTVCCVIIIIMMYSEIFHTVHCILQGDCSVLLKWLSALGLGKQSSPGICWFTLHFESVSIFILLVRHS